MKKIFFIFVLLLVSCGGDGPSEPQSTEIDISYIAYDTGVFPCHYTVSGEIRSRCSDDIDNDADKVVIIMQMYGVNNSNDNTWQVFPNLYTEAANFITSDGSRPDYVRYNSFTGYQWITYDYEAKILSMYPKESVPPYSTRTVNLFESSVIAYK
tara:strand:+ start:344 stop:805 length:462 start_codon:yes stop_codon:yes gene_type:complete